VRYDENMKRMFFYRTPCISSSVCPHKTAKNLL